MKIEAELKEHIEAQKTFCKVNQRILFAPTDGICFRCRKNIYQDYERTGRSLEYASSAVITGCPHCNSSFVD